MTLMPAKLPEILNLVFTAVGFPSRATFSKGRLFALGTEELVNLWPRALLKAPSKNFLDFYMKTKLFLLDFF